MEKIIYFPLRGLGSFIFSLLISLNFAYSQEKKEVKYTNPFEQAGIKNVKVATLSKGKYQEFHDLDSIVQIGTTLINVNSRKIVGYVANDSTNVMPNPTLISRWVSPDPLAEEAYNLTPYRYGFNNPILYNDPDGLWERTSNGWRTSDKDEIAEFVKATREVGGNMEVIDAKKKPETKEDELFRVVGDKGTSIFHGLERPEKGDDPMLRINSKKSEDAMNETLENIPMIGSGFKSAHEFQDGNYGNGMYNASMAGLDLYGGYGKIGIGATSTFVGLRYLWLGTRKILKSKLRAMGSDIRPALGASKTTLWYTYKAWEAGHRGKIPRTYVFPYGYAHSQETLLGRRMSRNAILGGSALIGVGGYLIYDGIYDINNSQAEDKDEQQK